MKKKHKKGDLLYATHWAPTQGIVRVRFIEEDLHHKRGGRAVWIVHLEHKPGKIYGLVPGDSVFVDHNLAMHNVKKRLEDAIEKQHEKLDKMRAILDMTHMCIREDEKAKK